jgi:hypothetical protein
MILLSALRDHIAERTPALAPCVPDYDHAQQHAVKAESVAIEHHPH